MLPAEVIALCILLLASLCGVDAQAKFEWGFTESVSTSLQSCKALALEADALPGGNNGVPPYYMMALPVNGTPIVTFIGTNESNLSWTPQFPAGTQLLLGVVDSERNTGGIDVPLYTVIAGDTQCIPEAKSDFFVTANVTDVLTTCQPWGLRIEGGVQPYNVTIAALNSATVTNSTLGPTDTVFTYINRADPGSQMIASVSDATGRWATGSPFVHTTGSSDVNCQGTISTSGNNWTPPGNDDSAPGHPAKLGAIIGGAGAALLFLCALAFGAIWWRRRRAARSPTLAIAPFETSALDHSWQMSAVRTPTPYPPPRGDHKHSGSGSASFLLPGSSSSSDPRWSSPSQSYNNSTGASTPTSASPLVYPRDLPPPPPYALPEFDPYNMKP